MKKLQHLPIICLAIVMVAFSVNTGYAQKFTKKKKYWEIGASLGIMNYVGELDPGQSFVSPGLQYTKPSVGVHLMRKFHPRLFWRAAFTYGRVKGDDRTALGDDGDFRRARDLNFRSDIFELKGDLIIDLFDNRGNYTKRSDYNVYGFIGLAGFYMRPQFLMIDQATGERTSTWVAAQPYKTEGKSYSSFQMAIPFGLGFRYKLSKQWDLAFEIGWRRTFTDYLDDVSTTYAGPENLPRDTWYIADRSAAAQYYGHTTITNPSMTQSNVMSSDGQVDNYTHLAGFGQKGDQRGDKNTDWYIVTGFHLSYIIPERVVCPKFRN